MTTPLYALAGLLAPSRDPAYAAALRVVEALCSGQEPASADLVLAGSPLAAVRLLCAHIQAPPGSFGPEVSDATQTLFALAHDLDDSD